MTGTRTRPQKVRSSFRPVRLACVAPILVLFTIRVALAQANSQPLDVYSGDSALRREPAATVFPEYPEEARFFRLEGETTVCFRINAQGEVIRPRVARSTDRIFERPSLRAIRASAFTPLEFGEIASAADVCRVYRFRLNPLAPPDAAPTQTPPPHPAEGVTSPRGAP